MRRDRHDFRRIKTFDLDSNVYEYKWYEKQDDCHIKIGPLLQQKEKKANKPKPLYKYKFMKFQCKYVKSNRMTK